MKKIKYIAAALAAAMAVTLSGCSDLLDDDISTESVPTNSSSTSGTGDNQNGDTKNYDNGATTLSVSDGSVKINRRTRAESKPMGEKGWTILVYLCGTDLESKYGAATSDIFEAISAQYSEDVHIVYQTGGTNQWKCDIANDKIQRYVNIDGDIEKVGELPAASMGNSDTLADFVSWGVENYPAEKMGLVFWNHGGGSISGVCFDENYDKDSLSLREIDKALNSVYDKMTDKFEFIGFDACLMSTLETANILVPYARYMFASEETEPGGGWNYTDIMNYLAENPKATGADLGKMQCPSYYQHCIDNDDYEGTTFAITDLSKIDELLVSFDKTAKQIYESDKLNAIARAINDADNFGGNNQSEGYTNMVDLKGLLNEVKPYASNAADTLNKLDSAIVDIVNGPNHENAGGLSLYYPLAVQGSDELKIFADVCTSSWYLGFVDKVAYGTTGNDISGYNNTQITNDCNDLWGGSYTANENAGTNNGQFEQADDECTIPIEKIYFDEDGTYTVKLSNMDAFYFAACSVFAEFDGESVCLGEDDDIIVDYDNMILQDNFNGTWVTFGNVLLFIEIVDVSETKSVYTSPIVLNGKETNLRLEYDFNTQQWKVIGAWAGIDEETGCAARETEKLKKGDVIIPRYISVKDGNAEYTTGSEYTVTGNDNIEYKSLFAADYSYSMKLYDVYGNCFFTKTVTFTVDEDGTIIFNPEELGQ